jgi:hypothetical protein
MEREKSNEEIRRLRQEIANHNPDGLLYLHNAFENAPSDFNKSVHLLILNGLRANIDGIERSLEEDLRDLDSRAGEHIGSDRYVTEWEEFQGNAAEQKDYAYNLYFRGLMDLFAETLTRIAWEIDTMVAYLPPEAPQHDPRALVIDLLKWGKFSNEIWSRT